MARSEPELYKDKIEVSLDGRQIFYLFFGGAVIACLVFALGVLVGKRVEARAHVDRAATTATRDPLAALDALDATGRGAASAPAPAAGQMERAVTDLDGAQRAAAAPVVAPASAPAAPAPAARPAGDDDPAPASAPEKAERDHADHDHAEHDKGDHDKGDHAKKKKKHDDDAPAAKPDDAAAADAAKPADDQDVAQRDGADHDKDKKKTHFTLQLSSFQDKGEAQAFLDSVQGSGYAPYLVEADVDGKGTFWRVRLGQYGSYDDAIVAKTDFEAKVKKVAYVTKL